MSLLKTLVSGLLFGIWDAGHALCALLHTPYVSVQRRYAVYASVNCHYVLVHIGTTILQLHVLLLLTEVPIPIL